MSAAGSPVGSAAPLAMEVSSIGTWEHIFLGILFLAIPTNVGLVLFTTRLLEALCFFVSSCRFY